ERALARPPEHQRPDEPEEARADEEERGDRQEPRRDRGEVEADEAQRGAHRDADPPSPPRRGRGRGAVAGLAGHRHLVSARWSMVRYRKRPGAPSSKIAEAWASTVSPAAWSPAPRTSSSARPTSDASMLHPGSPMRSSSCPRSATATLAVQRTRASKSRA